MKHLSQIYQFTILSFLITLQFTAVLAIKKPPNAKLTVMTRKLCNIDSDSLCTDIRSSSVYNSPSFDLLELCDQHDSESVLSSILDKHAPLRKRVISIRPLAPWYSEEIKKQKVMASFPTHFRLSILYRTTHCCKEHYGRNYPKDCQLVTGIRSFSVFFENCCSISTT